MTHEIIATDPKEPKEISQEEDFSPMQKDGIAYPDQFDETLEFLEEDEV